jgi:hypothetical protein
MRDSFDITIDVSTMLDVPAIRTLIGTDGEIYQSERPSGRTDKTDIVVNAWGITNDALQKGSGNINIYAPGIISGHSMVADQAKLLSISRAIYPLIDSQYRTNYQTWIEYSATIMRDTDGSWFVNMPFEYQSVQDNFKNI